MDGAKTLSVQQWALALAQKVAGEGYVDATVGLPTAVILLVAVTVGATVYIGQRLRRLTLAGEE